MWLIHPRSGAVELMASLGRRMEKRRGCTQRTGERNLSLVGVTLMNDLLAYSTDLKRVDAEILKFYIFKTR